MLETREEVTIVHASYSSDGRSASIGIIVMRGDGYQRRMHTARAFVAERARCAVNVS